MALFASVIMKIMLKYRWLSWAGLVFLVYLTAMMLFDGARDLGLIALQTAVAQSAGGPVGLFPERGRAGMGPQGYLSRYDAVHGHPGDWPDPDLYLPANRTLVANNDLWRISRLWP